MRIETTVAGARAAARDLQPRGLGLVPTMGALHHGHLSLVRAARERCGAVAASIFVNPTQFGPTEDFARYPRTFEQDCALLEAAGVDLLFAPPVEEIYPPGASTVVEVPEIGDRLDGASRPGHFRGVATVVAKLFHVIAPQRAFFGQKDAAQVAVLRRMVRDLLLDVELVICPTIRESDGLALSSRNRYLAPDDRQRALVLSRALHEIRARYEAGERASDRLLEAARALVHSEPAARLDYLALVNPETLLPLETAAPGTLAAIALWIGNTRLIDNLLL
jgi:pantoate--beta-alanine ligase